MRKKVWIWNHYATNTYFDQGGRHYNFAKFLAEAGYEPVIFCAATIHNSSRQVDTGGALWTEKPDSVCPYVFVKTRPYAGNGKQRVLNMVDFYRGVKKAALEYAKVHGKPDIIYASSVHPLTLVAGIQIARHFGVKCICEVRDLWPEGIVAQSARLTKNNPLIRMLYRGERWIYEKADAMIFTMEGGYDYIREQGWDRTIPQETVFHINNGVDLTVFDENRVNFPFEDVDLQQKDVFCVVYAGSIRRVNNLGLVVETAKQLTDTKIRFLIWGDGDERQMLEQRVRDEGIPNVVFKGRVEKKYIPSIVSQADLNLVHWEHFDLLRFGASYNKLFEYLAAGKPIFCTVQPGYSIVEGNNCGSDTRGLTPKDFASGIRRIYEMTEQERTAMGDNARKAAQQYDFRILTNKLIEIIERV